MLTVSYWMDHRARPSAPLPVVRIPSSTALRTFLASPPEISARNSRASSSITALYNATVAGKKDMEEVVGKARDNQGMYGKRTILFIDEIHRFNKGQQDYLLPFVASSVI